MKRLSSIIFILFLAGSISSAQSEIVKDFKPVCDSLNTLIEERTTVAAGLKLKAVMKRGGSLDFYFTESLSDLPWYKNDPNWFRSNLKALFPEKYKNYKLGEIYSRRVSLTKLVTPELGFNGLPSETRLKTKEPSRTAFVKELDGKNYNKGLSGRNIAVWQSHGRYFNSDHDRWMWQRACLFQTVEDLYTQSYVLPYLVPMLENAGAYVMLPRERDIQTNEVIADNDLTGGGRGTARYSEKGKWSDAGRGFADTKENYVETENPFTMGTSRKIECIPSGRNTTDSYAEWTPEIPERGEYAVYVAYRSLPNSSTSACYTVTHLGGKSTFVVNQKIGGGTWIYLGTFEFDKGASGSVRLSNRTPKGYNHAGGSVVTADAVKFGGGMGNIARSANDSTSVLSTSGYPRSAEGARYWLQWAGVDPEIYSQNEEVSDYKDDFMCRGDWVRWISGGSAMNPKEKGLGIPVDMSLGFHSDAGVTPDDGTIGTLAIYTLTSEGRQSLPSGESRMTSREYADMVQSQIVHDLRHEYDSLWNRRSTWDRAYRESRTPSSPALLLELLSHQNFADMKYGLDPSFRFTVSRSIYKGMLKYLSNRYGVQYQVQPLPVKSLAVRFGSTGKALVSWCPVEDPLEPTAKPEGFILYSRVDDGGFDNGVEVKEFRKNGDRFVTEVDIKPGHIYSFRITAYNEGGKSFPSETVSIGIPAGCNTTDNVLIVNNFDRVSGPAFFDTPSYAGFDNRLDSGVPHIRDIAYIGEMYQFRRGDCWVDDDNSGFGASYRDYAGKTVAGNTFDYPYVHGKAVMGAGHPFFSCSADAFCNDSTMRLNAWSVDLICGKQVTTVIGSGKQKKYTVFTPELQEALTAFASDGGNILVSGSNIGTDIWSCVYPHKADSAFTADSKKFAEKVLGFRWRTNHASRKGIVSPVKGKAVELADSVSFRNTPNPVCYSVETPDGIVPASSKAFSIMTYNDTEVSAGIGYEAEGYRTVCLGFPIEVVCEEEDLFDIIRTTLEFFKR